MSVHAAALELNVEKTVATSLAELLDRQSLPNVAGKDLGMATPIRKPQALQVSLCLLRTSAVDVARVVDAARVVDVVRVVRVVRVVNVVRVEDAVDGLLSV
ncbi:hypothetical protein KRP22_008255 [Phytophthora ramorum]|nr:hypothetical protein KRP22_3734 [Phytophthora ramorum]